MSAPQETISASHGKGEEAKTFNLQRTVRECVTVCDLCICMTVHSYTVMQISVGVAPAATLYEQSNNCKGRRQQSGAGRPFFNSMLSAPLLLIFMLINLTT